MELWITHLCSAQTKVANREVAAHTMWLKGVSLVSSFLLNLKKCSFIGRCKC